MSAARGGNRRNERTVAGILLAALRVGRPLSDAARGHPAWFEPADVAVLSAGEARGELRAAFESIDANIRDRQSATQKLWSTIAYPTTVLFVFVVALTIVAHGPLPQLLGALERSGVEPPAISLYTMRIGGLAPLIAAGLLVGAVASAAALAVAVSALPTAVLWQPLAWKPLRLVNEQITARLCGHAAMMLRSGIPLYEALGTVERGGGVIAALVGHAADRLRSQIRDGVSIAEATASEPWASHETSTILRVGHESGRLGEAFASASERAAARVTRARDRFVAALGPALIVLLTGLVAVLVLATMTPMFHLKEVLR
jgi:general secretion pathway protein F